jgi:hypothetical protein
VVVDLAAVADDLRLPRFEWSPTVGAIESVTSRTTRLHLDTTSIPPGGALRATVNVTAVDADNLRVTASRSIAVQIVEACRPRP